MLHLRSANSTPLSVKPHFVLQAGLRSRRSTQSQYRFRNYCRCRYCFLLIAVIGLEHGNVLPLSPSGNAAGELIDFTFTIRLVFIVSSITRSSESEILEFVTSVVGLGCQFLTARLPQAECECRLFQNALRLYQQNARA